MCYIIYKYDLDGVHFESTANFGFLKHNTYYISYTLLVEDKARHRSLYIGRSLETSSSAVQLRHQISLCLSPLFSSASPLAFIVSFCFLMPMLMLSLCRQHFHSIKCGICSVLFWTWCYLLLTWYTFSHEVCGCWSC